MYSGAVSRHDPSTASGAKTRQAVCPKPFTQQGQSALRPCANSFHPPFSPNPGGAHAYLLHHRPQSTAQEHPFEFPCSPHPSYIRPRVSASMLHHQSLPLCMALSAAAPAALLPSYPHTPGKGSATARCPSGRSHCPGPWTTLSWTTSAPQHLHGRPAAASAADRKVQWRRHHVIVMGRSQVHRVGSSDAGGGIAEVM